MKITVLVENTTNNNLASEHGLCLYVEFKKKNYLIDAGASLLFLENAKKLNIDLANVDCGFLSHAHYDHSSGYDEFFKINSKALIYAQKSAMNKCFYKIVGPLKKYIGVPKNLFSTYLNRFKFVNGCMEIDEGVFVITHTSEKIIKRAKETNMCMEIGGKIVFDDFSHEQTIVFKTDDGLVCFNSCSHCGVDVALENVKKTFPSDSIKAYVGGFHLMGALGVNSIVYEQEEVKNLANSLLESSDAMFYSGHCTGNIGYKWLKEVMKDRIDSFYVGKIIKL